MALQQIMNQNNVFQDELASSSGGGGGDFLYSIKHDIGATFPSMFNPSPADSWIDVGGGGATAPNPGQGGATGTGPIQIPGYSSPITPFKPITPGIGTDGTPQTDMQTLADLYQTLFGQSTVTPASGTGDVQLVPSTTTTSNSSMLPIVLIGFGLAILAYVYYKNKKKKGD